MGNCIGSCLYPHQIPQKPGQKRGVDDALAIAASKTVTGKTSLAELMSSKEENADALPA